VCRSSRLRGGSVRRRSAGKALHGYAVASVRPRRHRVDDGKRALQLVPPTRSLPAARARSRSPGLEPFLEAPDARGRQVAGGLVRSGAHAHGQPTVTLLQRAAVMARSRSTKRRSGVVTTRVIALVEPPDKGCSRRAEYTSGRSHHAGSPPGLSPHVARIGADRCCNSPVVTGHEGGPPHVNDLACPIPEHHRKTPPPSAAAPRGGAVACPDASTDTTRTNTSAARCRKCPTTGARVAPGPIRARPSFARTFRTWRAARRRKLRARNRGNRRPARCCRPSCRSPLRVAPRRSQLGLAHREAGRSNRRGGFSEPRSCSSARCSPRSERSGRTKAWARIGRGAPSRSCVGIFYIAAALVLCPWCRTGVGHLRRPPRGAAAEEEAFR